MVNKDLDMKAMNTFVCPNLSMIDDICKDEVPLHMIEKTKEIAIEYVKKTYHHPRYPNIKMLLPAFLYIAVHLETNEKGERIIGRCEIKNTMSKEFCGFLFDVSVTTVRKWINKITEELGIQHHETKIQCVSGETHVNMRIGATSWATYEVV